jgi:hypothetical protein
MPIPIVPIAVGVWKVVNIVGNAVFFGQLGHKAYKKIKEKKDKKEDQEKINRAE